MHRILRHAVVGSALSLLCFLAVGCSGETPRAVDSDPGSSTGQEAPATAGSEAAAGEVTVRAVDLEGYQKAIEAQRGKVVLVDFWATWCVPCKKQFPHTVELGRELADEGLAVISVSMDEVESDPASHEPILKFLKDQNARFTNLIATTADGSDPFEAFDIDGGAIPHYKLYDRNGQLVRKFYFDAETSYTQEDIDTAVKELLSRG